MTHIVLLPFFAYGHMIPMTDMAVLFASRGLKTTIITTSSNAHRFTTSIQKTLTYPHQIALHIIDFVPELPPEFNNPDLILATELLHILFDAILTIRDPFDHFIEQSRPDCIVADMFFPWTVDTASKFNIPRIAFNGSGFFPVCVAEAIRVCNPIGVELCESEAVVVPSLPHEIKISRRELPQMKGGEMEAFFKVIVQAAEAEAKSYGVVFNSFYEMEREYVEHYREVMKRKAWHIGPLSLCVKRTEDRWVERGRKSSIDEDECVKWLDSKPPGSVIYISFGTLVKITSSQLLEIAMGLEACDENFVWVIKNDQESSIPEGFEERVKAKGKGLLIKGWAPQALILEHESVGGFLTHCGWNSVLEGISGGVAMVTWPVMAEQFYNAKLVTSVLQIGVSVGDVRWSMDSRCEGVKREAIEKAVKRVMGVEEGDKMRMRAREMKEKAKTAVEEGGSSYLNLTTFIEDIKAFKCNI